MLMSSPLVTVPKSSFLNVPLLLALLITSAVHLLFILGLKITLPEQKKNHNTIVITLFKPPTRHQLATQQPVPVQPITTSKAVTPKPVAVKKSLVPSLNHSTPLTKLPRDKKRRKLHSSPRHITQPDFSTSPNTDIAANFPAVEPKVETESAPPVVLKPIIETKTTAIPAPASKPKVEVEAIDPVIPTPVAVPDTPAVSEPIPAEKVETTPVTPDVVAPVVAKPAEIDGPVVQPESLTPDVVEKPAELPKKAAKKSRRKSAKGTTAKVSNVEETPPPLSLDDLAAQIAQVGEKYANQPETTGGNRIKSLNSVRSHKVSAQQYTLDWQHKVERIGNLNYPEAARQKDFTARLVMEVGINSDGSIHSIKIKKSSGTPALDEAAKNIVQMGAPYAALPNDLAEELNILIIQRTWKFSDESGMTTQ